MTTTVETSWTGPGFTAERLAAALECTVHTVEELIALLVSHQGSGRSRSLTGTERVGLAVASALHRQARLSTPAAAAIVRNCWGICESVSATLDFSPPSSGRDQGRSAERDPFMFFTPYAAEAAAVPVIDEFVDVIDGRRICWRRPLRDAYRLACEVHRLSEAVRSDDTPALQEEYLELLSGLRGPAAQVSDWIGMIDGDVFRPAPDRFAEPLPAMRQGPEIGADPSRSANTCGTCVSVNVSLAARCFKRRMLGLEVTDPFVRRPAARRTNEGASVRR